MNLVMFLFVLLLLGAMVARAIQKRRKDYPKHVCDRRYDGMCVECQLNAGKAFIDGLLKQKS